MLFPFPLRISNYRSIGDDLEIPFQKKITFLVGQNNSGKSNILRILSILFNKAYGKIDEERDFDSNKKVIEISTWLSSDYLKTAISKYSNARTRYAISGYNPLRVDLDISKNGLSFPESNKQHLDITINDYFGHGDAFLRDFGQSGGNNHAIFLQSIKFEEILPGTA